MDKPDDQKKVRKSTEIRQKEIIDAAARILTNEGASHFTADRLGEEVGLASGSLFRHFESKEDILDGIVDRIEEIIFCDFPPESDNPIERLRLFFMGRTQAIVNYPEFSKLLITSTLIPRGGSNTREKRLQEFKQRSKDFLRSCLKEAKDAGLLAEDISFQESTILVQGAISAIGQLTISADGFQGEDDLIERVWNLLERSLSRR